MLKSLIRILFVFGAFAAVQNQNPAENDNAKVRISYQTTVIDGRLNIQRNVEPVIPTNDLTATAYVSRDTVKPDLGIPT